MHYSSLSLYMTRSRDVSVSSLAASILTHSKMEPPLESSLNSPPHEVHVLTAALELYPGTHLSGSFISVGKVEDSPHLLIRN